MSADRIIACAPSALLRFQETQGALEAQGRMTMSDWLRLFDLMDEGLFDVPDGGHAYLAQARAQGRGRDILRL